MADETLTASGAWLNIIVGLAIVVATLLSGNLAPDAFWFSLLAGALLAALAAYAAMRWEGFAPRRRVLLCAACALVALVILAEWWSADYPVSLRRVMIVLGLAGALVGTYAAYRSRAPT